MLNYNIRSHNVKGGENMKTEITQDLVKGFAIGLVTAVCLMTVAVCM